MSKAAIYARVSTGDQEREGTSLGSQREACERKAYELGFDVAPDYVLEEVYSGLTLDRPKLLTLRQWVRDKEVETVFAYSTDRLSRDPVHLLLLAEEFDKAKCPLIFVTEPMDNSMEGQLLGFVRGWASKLEAVKIQERTARGRKTRALSGKLPANSHAHLYGYHYIPGKGVGEGVRYVNEEQAKWVREMFKWLVEEGLSTDAITYRLRALNVGTPSGKGYWIRSTVQQILKNRAYYGKTYAFTRTYGEPKFRMKPDTKREKTGLIWKPREEWVEIPNATPPIISEELFDLAQKRLQRNKELATRNTRHEYLLHGHIYCRHCGRSYWGYLHIQNRNGKHYESGRYKCSGRLKRVTPVPCGNRSHSADYLESLVWGKVEAVLSKPELILSELHRREQEAKQRTFLQRDLEVIETKLANREKQKVRIWKAFEITGDEETFRRDIALLDKEIDVLKEGKLNLETRIKGSKQFEFDVEGVKKACKLIKNKLGELTFADKRLALEALRIKVWIDGDFLDIEGVIPIHDIVNMQSGWHLPVLHRKSLHGACHLAW